MSYCIYLRKSRKDKELEMLGEGETLSRHEKILLSLAQKQNLQISHIYKEVLSGETIFQRPEMCKLLRAVECGKYKGVLVMEIERLARGSAKEQGIVAEAFQLSGTLIITPEKVYNPSNEFDEEYFEFGLFMSRREYKTINRRIQSGRRTSLNEGKYIASTAPFGYDRIKIKSGKGYTLCPNDDADTVRLIYKLYTDMNNPSGMQLIAKKLDNMGLRPSNSQSWSRSSVKDILTNPAYVGRIRWGRRKTVSKIENGKIKKCRAKGNEYIIVEGLHEALISAEDFEKAQQILNDKRILSVSGNKNIKNPLAGLIVCGGCGKLMSRGSGSSGCFLKCTNTDCKMVSSNIDIVEKAVIQALEVFLKGHKINFDKCHIDDNYEEAIIKKYERKLNIMKKQLKNIHIMLEKEIYTEEIFIQRNLEIKSEMEKITNIMRDIKIRCDNHRIKPAGALGLIEAYKLTADAKQKNNILRELIEKALYIKTEKGSKNNPSRFVIKVYPKIKSLL